MSTKIGLISDTHGLLRPEVLNALESCDSILHAGDIGSPAILNALIPVAPLYAVRGNNDGKWAESLPRSQAFRIEGINFFMMHKRSDLPEDLGPAKVVVFGHSHKYFEKWIDGRLWINPGSCGTRRFHCEISLATLIIDHGNFLVQKIPLF